MTGPAIDPKASPLPPFHRVLMPDEFEAARQMSPDAIAQSPFPIVPPAAPKDAVRANDPNQGPDRSLNHPRPKSFGGAVADIGNSMLTHPLQTAITTPLAMTGGAVGTAVASVYGLSMLHDIGAYAGQKAAEMTLDPATRKIAESDPNRISGGQVGADLTAAAAFGVLSKGLRNYTAAVDGKLPDPTAPDVVTGDRAAKVTGAMQAGESARAARAQNAPGLESALQQHSADVADAVNTITPQQQARLIFRAGAGEAARLKEQAAFKLDEFRRAIDPLPQADKLGFWDAIESGESQPNPVFQKAADTMRQALDTQRDAVQNLGTGALEHYIEDYAPHAWKDPEAAAEAFTADRAKLLSRAPLEGTKSSLKQRTIPTVLDGIKLGLEPKFDNPVDLFMYKYADMQKYVLAHTALNEMKDAGLVQYVGAGAERPDGWGRINDNIVKVFGPRQGAVTLPEGANVNQSDVGVLGQRTMGEYWAPKEVAGTVNNYLSPGLASTLRNAMPGPAGELAAQSYDMYRQFGNTLNQAQLGLSAFHVMASSVNTAASRAALGLEYLTSGDVGRGLGEIASAPAAPATPLAQATVGDLLNRVAGTDIQMGVGAKLRAAYRDPTTATPEFRELAEAYAEGGGRIALDPMWKNSAAEKLTTAWRSGDFGDMAKYALPAFFEYASKPIQEHIVPLMKMQVFGEMAQKALADLPPDATIMQRRASMASIVDAVDDRLGQMTYDNLFWNKTFKDLAMASTRSVGWNLGTIRAGVGGATDLAGSVKSVATGGDLNLSHRAAFFAVYPFVVGAVGATYQMLRTGQAPSELKDYFHPKNGGTDANGDQDRSDIASYMKDFFAYTGHPVATLEHKASPVLSSVLSMIHNQDFYGDEIRNPNDPLVKQFQQEATFWGKQFLPFALTGSQEQTSRDGPGALGPFFGITPARREDVRGPGENAMHDLLPSAPAGRTPEQATVAHTKSAILAALRIGDTATVNATIANAIDDHNIDPKAIEGLLKRAGTSPAQEQFKRLTVPQALDVFRASSPDEKAKFAQLLIQKLERQSAKGSP